MDVLRFSHTLDFSARPKQQGLLVIVRIAVYTLL
jgi:hypothetical protein